MTAAVRQPAVAGRFYPESSERLARDVDGLVAEPPAGQTPAAALIAPHAGYPCSGPVAGVAYGCVRERRGDVRRVVVVGPAHFAPLTGLALPSADGMATPLGVVAIDADGREALLPMPQVSVDDGPHDGEHSLEVHLPFLQRVLGDVEVVPLLVGHADPDEVADVLEAVWDGDTTLVVASSDLSHYHDEATAKGRDQHTAEAIVARDVDAIGATDACGSVAVRGLLVAARRRHLDVSLLELGTSADTCGPPDRVVGYGAFALS